jgi:glycosyltransferase involved in cell wall biosynthesis
VSFSLSAAAIGILLTEAPDVVYVYNLVTLGLAAILLKTFKKCAIVYDIQDLWPDALTVSGMLRNRMAIGIVDRWCKFVYGMADRIVVLSPGFKEVLVSRGVPSDKTEVIYNWCDEDAIRHEECHSTVTTQIGLRGRFNIVFAGTMGKAQALDAVLDAAKLVFKKPEPIQFVFIGGGIEVEHLKQKATSMNLENVLFLPQRPTSEIEEILSSADVLLVHLSNDRLFEITIPSKIMAYMASGKPILAAVKGDAANLVKKANAGLTCTPQNPEMIAEAALRMCNLPRAELEGMGRNGQRFYEKELSLRTAVRRFDQVFKSCGMFNS